MRRLAADAALRARLGAAARAYWGREHSPSRMVDGYHAVIGQAAALPVPVANLPAAIVPSASAHADTLLAPFGDHACVSF
jgi:hypothetical protein